MPDFLAAGPRDVLVPESGAEAAREALAWSSPALRAERPSGAGAVCADTLRVRLLPARLDEDRLAGRFAGDRADLFRGALELGVGEDGVPSKGSSR